MDQLYIHDYDEKDDVGDMRQELVEKIEQYAYLLREVRFMGYESAVEFVEGLGDEHVGYWHRKWC